MMTRRLRPSQCQPAYVSSGAGTANGHPCVRGGRRALLACGSPPVCSPRQWPAMGVWASSRGFTVHQQDREDREDGRRLRLGAPRSAGPGQARGSSREVGWPGADHSSAREGFVGSLGVRVSQAGCGQGGAGARSARFSSKGVQGDEPTVPQPRIHRAPRERGAGDADHTPAALTAQLRAPVSATLAATRPPKLRHIPPFR